MRRAVMGEIAWAFALAARWIARHIDTVLGCTTRRVW